MNKQTKQRRDLVYDMFKRTMHREPTKQEVNAIMDAYDTIFPMAETEKQLREAAEQIERNLFMNPKGKYVVLNHNSQGVLVAALVEARSREDAVKLRSEHVGLESIVAVSSAVPSPWGKGGGYVYPVSVEPPVPIQPKTVIGPAAVHKKRPLL